jgi:hypothetical protein
VSSVLSHVEVTQFSVSVHAHEATHKPTWEHAPRRTLFEAPYLLLADAGCLHILPLDQYPFESRRSVNVSAFPVSVVMDAPSSVVMRTALAPVATSASAASTARPTIPMTEDERTDDGRPQNFIRNSDSRPPPATKAANPPPRTGLFTGFRKC